VWCSNLCHSDRRTALAALRCRISLNDVEIDIDGRTHIHGWRERDTERDTEREIHFRKKEKDRDRETHT
jgi:hypothetical protein